MMAPAAKKRQMRDVVIREPFSREEEGCGGEVGMGVGRSLAVVLWNLLIVVCTEGRRGGVVIYFCLFNDAVAALLGLPPPRTDVGNDTHRRLGTAIRDMTVERAVRVVAAGVSITAE